MTERTLDSLLRIALEGPEVDKFPVTDAVELWATVKSRRIFVHFLCICMSLSTSKYNLILKGLASFQLLFRDKVYLAVVRVGHH